MDFSGFGIARPIITHTPAPLSPDRHTHTKIETCATLMQVVVFALLVYITWYPTNVCGPAYLIIYMFRSVLVVGCAPCDISVKVGISGTKCYSQNTNLQLVPSGRAETQQY